ncbi:DUF4136 domain-containing protein [Algoriphagus persicinus]|uniref:DUF4136 domain-containing protein n=1 Tax=Algoriphagus persicinus TaxID=3108754 RepID=UPI002B3671C7|nr:DUF4136 domain-containing protein [Algoriphagus sp. E1-3-M2]MEB2784092.1 DUF4136 domain-containing protein [Algoriphagus sp. E1-3-M2]
MNRIRLNHIFYITLLILGLSSCSAIEIFKENTEVPIRKPYKSFVIINQEVGMRSFSSQLIDEQVQVHLQEALEAQGLVYDKTEPELVIRYTSNEDPRKRETTQHYNPYPYWGYRVWDPWMYNPYYNYRNNNSSTTNYELVQVIVDFIDQKEDKLLMTLTGVTEVGSPKTKSKKVLKTTDKIIGYFLNEVNNIQ